MKISIKSVLMLLAGTVTLSVAASFAPQVYAQGGGSDCENPTNKSIYKADIKRGTGTLTIKSGKALCKEQKIVFQSFNVPDTWDKKGWNKTAIPQTSFATTEFTIPAGQKNFSKTVSVAAPHECKNTQLDFYLDKGYESITTLTGDDERNLLGVLFAGKGACETPKEDKDIKVCDLSTYKVVTIKESQFDAKKHSKDVENCKKPVEKCEIPGKENLPKDSKDCVETPTTPEEPVTPEEPTTPETPKEEPAAPAKGVGALPETGLAAIIAPVLGLGSLTASAYYYLVSRRG